MKYIKKYEKSIKTNINKYEKSIKTNIKNRLSEIRTTIESSNDVNHRNIFNGSTVLMDSVCNTNNDTTLFNYVMSYPGVDVNITDNYGRNALWYAVTHNFEYAVKILLKKFSNPNVVFLTDYRTPLIQAAINTTFGEEEDIMRAVRIIIMLIQYGADWDYVDKKDNFLPSGNRGDRTFFEYLSDDIKGLIIQMFPEKYEDYLIKKEAEKYNL